MDCKVAPAVDSAEFTTDEVVLEMEWAIVSTHWGNGLLRSWFVNCGASIGMESFLPIVWSLKPGGGGTDSAWRLKEEHVRFAVSVGVTWAAKAN
jgi:hypothetical protein